MSRKGIVSDLERDAVALNTPTPSDPAPAADQVACVHCARMVPLRETDVVGLGYRCRACCDRAELAELEGERPDVADHLIAEDRARFAEAGRKVFVRTLWVFVGMVALGTVLLIVIPSPAAVKILLSALITLLAVGGHGYSRWQRFRVR